MIPKWDDALQKLHRLDGHSWEYISTVVDWLLKDDIPQHKRGPVRPGRRPWAGWFHNCRSPMKLRTRNGDGIRYFDVLAGKATERRLGQPEGRKAAWDKKGDVDPWA